MADSRHLVLKFTLCVYFASQGSSAISSADLFGHDSDANLDISASDLINRLSFQVLSTYIQHVAYLL